MSIVITREDIMAYAEVDYIIHHMNEKYISKVPEKLLNFFSVIKDPEYVVHVDPRVPLQNQNLKKYTLELLALIHLKYWCEDEDRRKMLYERMMENQRKLDVQMREKYNIDNMFDMTSTANSNTEDFNEHKSVVSADENDFTDYSKPKDVIKTNVVENNIENYEGETQEIKEENKLKNYFEEGAKELNQLEEQEKSILQRTGFLMKIINKIKSIFVKNKE